MFNVLLAVAYIVTISTASSTPECEPSNFLCSGICPHFPEDLELTSESVCLRDIESDACVCWMNNPASYLQSLFRCETKVNGTVSQYMCNPPPDCFSPDPDRPVCMIVLQCSCLLDTRFPHKVFDHWKRVKAVVHTKVKKRDYNRQPVEKVHGEAREFNLKHLLFLIGFVVAPLLCWCVLNFFQDGRCRKKTTDPPEAQPMPTSRSSTIDNMNNCEDLCADRNCEDVVVVVTPSHNPRSSSVCSLSVPALHPSAPGDLDIIETAQQQTLIKCESPPPYCESMERSIMDAILVLACATIAVLLSAVLATIILNQVLQIFNLRKKERVYYLKCNFPAIETKVLVDAAGHPHYRVLEEYENKLRLCKV